MNIYKLCATISLFILSYSLSKLREKCFGKKILEVITFYFHHIRVMFLCSEQSNRLLLCLFVVSDSASFEFLFYNTLKI